MTHMLRNRWAAAVVLSAALVLTGCGGDDKDTDAKSSVSSNPFGGGSSESTETPEPTESEPTESESTEPEPTEAETSATEEPTLPGSDDSDTPLARYVDLLQPKLEAAKDSFGDMYTEITATAIEPGTLVYSYTFKANPPAGAADALAGSKDTLQAGTDAEATAMKALGISDPKVKYVYLRPDGSEIWSITTSPK